MKLLKRCRCTASQRCSHPYWFRFFLHGREYRASTHTGNRTLATRIAEKRKVEVLEGRTGLRRRSVPRLSKFIPDYTGWTAKTSRTAYKDAGVLAGFVASVGDQRLYEVSPFHIERWKTLRAKDVQPATVNRELNIIRGCFARAVEWGRLTVSPVRGVQPYRVENTRTRILSSEEIQSVLDGSSGDLGLIARATLESLFRLSDVLRLRAEDIGPTFATVVHSKNGRRRHVPLTAELRSDLLQRAHASGWIFGEDRYEGQPATQSAVTIAFCRLMRRLNVQGASHHTLRHTGASAMVAAGVSVLAPLAVDQAAARCSYDHESVGNPPAAVSTTATNTRRVTSRPVKMSLRANRLLTRRACMAGVLVSRPNRKARCGRTKL